MFIVYRPIRSSLDEALKELIYFETFTHLFIHFVRKLKCDRNDLSIVPYDLTPDTRCGWHETCMLLLKGEIIGFVGTF